MTGWIVDYKLKAKKIKIGNKVGYLYNSDDFENAEADPWIARAVEALTSNTTTVRRIMRKPKFEKTETEMVKPPRRSSRKPTFEQKDELVAA